MAGPTNFSAEYKAVMRDQVTINLYWDPVPEAIRYHLYRDNVHIQIDPPFSTEEHNNSTQIVYSDIVAWSKGMYLDLFYWVSYEDSNGVESEKTGPLTNLHPLGVRVIEEARSMIADDLTNLLGDERSVFEQLSTYNYKIAMDTSLNDIKMTPTPTPGLHYGNFPVAWKPLLVLGTVVYVLPKIELLETAKQIQFSDQGQSWTPPDLSAKLRDLREFYKDMYDRRRIEVKHNVKPLPLGVGSLRALYLSPQMARFRLLPTQVRPYF